MILQAASLAFVILGLDPRIGPSVHADMTGFAYIVTNRPRGTLYIGVTSDLARRVHEHREALVKGFTSRYELTCLVWYEEHFDIREAIQREKSLKRWYRNWKVDLIEATNPNWEDLYPYLGR